ncbi:MAG: hypothetical protein HYU53_13915 [Acidobacteria bacterium]|nr:hypothetical protein [Acidobacteriota bacterium]
MTWLQPTGPIIVRVVEEPARETTVVDVLLGSIGLTGLVLLIAAIAGLALGGILVWLKKRRGDSLEITAQTLELSPTQEKR